MSDATYDAVVIGGGTKALFTAMYLAKYGGMEVGIFERRHELGGGLASSESAAPGFIGDTHATNMSRWYYLPIQDDFPDFAEKGGKLANYGAVLGAISREDHNCVVLYSSQIDPDQERSASEIARLSQKDADTYLKLWELSRPGKKLYQAYIEEIFNLPAAPGEPTPTGNWLADYLKQPDCLIDAQWLTLMPYKAMQSLFENSLISYMWLRRALAGGIDAISSNPFRLILRACTIPELCFAVGGTHNIAHACIRILLEAGAKWFTRCEVDRILTENGEAKGIRLLDGTEIRARKLVVSGVDPYQLLTRLIGKDYTNGKVLRKLKQLEDDLSCITWFNWALREPPKFKAAEFNPDIDECHNVVLGSKDLEVLYKEALLRRLGKFPPVQSTLLWHTYSHVDKSRAPAGKYSALTEQFVPRGDLFSETEWLRFKKSHADDVIKECSEYAANMSWDKVVGYDPETPYDTARQLINMAPTGGWASGVDLCGVTRYLPIIELAHHRAPIKNLYATGGAWMAGGDCAKGYTCYKVIAEDMGLRKPWEEKGRSY